MARDAGTLLSFCGQPLSVEELILIQGIAQDFCSLGRTEIANTVCEGCIPKLLIWQSLSKEGEDSVIDR